MLECPVGACVGVVHVRVSLLGHVLGCLCGGGCPCVEGVGLLPKSLLFIEFF